MKKAPKDLLQREGLTQRQWRQLKRAELQALLRAMDAVMHGCVYTPHVDGVYLGEMNRKLSILKKAWSKKEWGS